MKPRISFVIVLAITLMVVSTVFAQAVFPHLNGAVADATGQLSASDVQAAADRLSRQTGAIPIALAYNNKGGLTADTYEKGFLEANGMGNPDKGNLSAKVILIAIDYQDRGIKIWYGDAFRAALDPKIQQIQEGYVVANALSDPTQAYVQGFDQISQAINLYQNPPTQAPAQVTVQQTNTTVDTVGIGLAIWNVAKWILLVAILALIIWAFYAFVWPEYKKRSALIAKVGEHRRSMAVKNVAVMNRLPTDMTGNPSMAQLQLVLGPEQPTRAEELAEQYEVQRAATLSIQRRAMDYSRRSVNLFADYDAMEQLLAQYKQLVQDRTTIERWLQELDQEAERVAVATREAPGKVEATKKALAAAAEQYGASAANSTFLPEKAQAIGALVRLADEADGEIQANRPLSAVETVEQLADMIKEFVVAVVAITDAERMLQEVAPRLTQQIGGRQKEVTSVVEILSNPTDTLRQACAVLGEGSYDRADDVARQVVEQCTVAEEVVAALIAAMKVSVTRMTELQVIFSAGFRNAVTRDLAEVADDLVQANVALKKGDFAAVARWAGEIEGDSQRALQTMQRLQQLHASNQARIKALSTHVAAADKRRREQVQPKWGELQKDFHPDNWEEVRNHFEQAGKLIAALFDDPKDSDDLASRAERLNSMDVQDFVGAEAVIVRMEADLAKASLLLDQLTAQHAKAVAARENHKKAIATARAKFEAAVAARDAKNRWIGPEVDKLLVQARDAAVNAEEAAKATFYTDCMGYCQDVVELADRALASATRQVSEISALIAEKESAKIAARQTIAVAEEAIKRATRAAVLRRTSDNLAEAVVKTDEAGRQESKALTLEDMAMAQAFKESAVRYKEAALRAQDAQRSLQQDVAEYERLLDQARDAVESAQAAIRSAQRECDDHRAGSSGDSALSRAKSILPQAPTSGATREAIGRVIEAAESARSEAQHAEREAESAVAAYVRREREEEERRRREEQRRREEERRAEERRRSSSSSSSSFGSGGSSSRSSFGSGGSSSRSGF